MQRMQTQVGCTSSLNVCVRMNTAVCAWSYFYALYMWYFKFEVCLVNSDHFFVIIDQNQPKFHQKSTKIQPKFKQTFKISKNQKFHNKQLFFLNFRFPLFQNGQTAIQTRSRRGDTIHLPEASTKEASTLARRLPTTMHLKRCLPTRT